jgi:antitoxin (DNA-binding transcriptional repressor) of toxin-antitoxin stability system
VNTEINAGDLEVQFFRILKRVKQGERFTITIDGEAVAEMAPSAKKRSAEEVAAAVKALQNLPRIEGVSGETVLEWIREGRR